MSRPLITIFLTVFFAIQILASSAFGQNVENVSAFSYARINQTDETDSEHAVTAAQFDDHLTMIEQSALEVFSTTELIQWRHNTLSTTPNSFSNNGILLILETTRRDTIDTALELIGARDIPLHILITTDNIGLTRQHISWRELRRLKDNKKITIGLQGCQYVILTTLSPSQQTACLNRAVSLYEEKIGERPHSFAFPFGVYDTTLLAKIQSYNFPLIFGAQSGVIAHDVAADTPLPRFQMASNFATTDRFKQLSHAKALKVQDIMPEDVYLNTEDNPPAISFTVDSRDINPHNITCFMSDIGQVPVQPITKHRLAINLETPLPMHERMRLNCTYYSTDEMPILYWFGQIFYLSN